MHVNTIDFVDIAKVGPNSVLSRAKERGVLEQIKAVEASLPFFIRGFDCDNGTEPLHWELVRHFSDRKRPVQFTRSRHRRKDANAHIEQLAMTVWTIAT